MTVFRRYVSGYYTNRDSGAIIIDVHPALILTQRVELCRALWKELGISWEELGGMDPHELQQVMEILQIRSELRGGGSGCPFA